MAYCKQCLYIYSDKWPGMWEECMHNFTRNYLGDKIFSSCYKKNQNKDCSEFVRRKWWQPTKQVEQRSLDEA
jgi:hypothetical protein